MKEARRLLAAALLGAGLLGVGGAARGAELTPMEVVRMMNQAFTEVADEVSPSVVVLDVSQRASGQSLSEAHPFWEFLPPDFRRQLEPDPETDRVIQGQGSGVVIREDGYILTNSHVVDGAERIRVRFLDGREYAGEVRGVDPQSDLAVVRIEATGLPAAKFADSERVRVGEFAIAIGAPFDLEYSVTFGHVSAKGRSAIVPDPSMDQDFIQTDANINPGNSGGPLVNIDGEVMGINTLIRGLRTGIGFAIPSNLAKEVAAQLIENGRFVRSWLGIEIRALRDYPDYQPRVEGIEDGVVVMGIVRDGPAANSELRLGDVILSVGKRKVATAQELKNEVRSKPVGKPLELQVVRDNQRRVIEVMPAEWPEDLLASISRPTVRETGAVEAVGMTVRPLTSELARQYELKSDEGLVVTEVDPAGVAARSGISRGDVITEIDNEVVTNAADYRRAIKGADLKRGVMVNVARDGVNRFVLLKETGE